MTRLLAQSQMMTKVTSAAPIVILARPQMGENIGAAARAMMNCGLADLRLVSPRDGWPNPLAMPMAAGGRKILENAVVFESWPLPRMTYHL